MSRFYIISPLYELLGCLRALCLNLHNWGAGEGREEEPLPRHPYHFSRAFVPFSPTIFHPIQDGVSRRLADFRVAVDVRGGTPQRPEPQGRDGQPGWCTVMQSLPYRPSRVSLVHCTSAFITSRSAVTCPLESSYWDRNISYESFRSQISGVHAGFWTT